MNKYLSHIYGLVTKNDPGTENGGLFLARYLTYKKMLGIPVDQDDYNTYMSKMDKAYVKYGLYLRSANHTTRTVSQDELTGFMLGSILIRVSIHKAVWGCLVSRFGSYPATGKAHWVNPGSYYAWAILGDSSFSFMLAPWYTINLLISTNKEKNDTSSKLIYIDELYNMKDKSWYSKLLYKYLDWRMTKMYGVKYIKSLVDIYYASEDMDHPIRELANRI